MPGILIIGLFEATGSVSHVISSLEEKNKCLEEQTQLVRL